MRDVFTKGNGFGDSSYNVYDGQTITAKRYGFTVTATIHHDGDNDAPWDNEDGHGPISDWRDKDSKRAGELVLCTDRNRARFYDFAEAVKQAKTEGWDAKPYNKNGRETKGQQAAKAARADFERMRAWCRDEWFYVGVAVTVAWEETNLIPKYAHALWGIESDAGDYLREVANELAAEAIEDAQQTLSDLGHASRVAKRRAKKTAA
jgi:hypothetical protein